MKKIENKKNSAFTLIELLAIIVILGIIIGLVLPYVKGLIENNQSEEYLYHEKVVKASSTAYVDKYKNNEAFSTNVECFTIPYQALIKEELLKEENVTCSGYVQAIRINDTKNYNYKYYLNCKDKKGNNISTAKKDERIGKCLGVGGPYKIEYQVKIGNVGGETYNVESSGPLKNGWVNDSIYIGLDSNNPYGSATEDFQYSKNNTNWTTINDHEKSFTIKDYNGPVYVRVIDEDNNISQVRTFNIKSDTAGPVISSSEQNKEGWAPSKTIAIDAKEPNNMVGLHDFSYSYDGGTTWVASNTKVFNNKTEEMSIVGIVRDKLGNESKFNTKVTKIDPEFPIVTRVGSGNDQIKYPTSALVTNYFTSTYGISGGSMTCNYTNLNQLPLGKTTIICTAKSGAGLTATSSYVFRHYYAATSTPYSYQCGSNCYEKEVRHDSWCKSGGYGDDVTFGSNGCGGYYWYTTETVCDPVYCTGYSYSCPKGGSLSGTTCYF